MGMQVVAVLFQRDFNQPRPRRHAEFVEQLAQRGLYSPFRNVKTLRNRLVRQPLQNGPQ
jgi:hypothetical protein